MNFNIKQRKNLRILMICFLWGGLIIALTSPVFIHLHWIMVLLGFIMSLFWWTGGLTMSLMLFIEGQK